VPRKKSAVASAEKFRERKKIEKNFEKKSEGQKFRMTKLGTG
jgi:hypothetical protein